MRKPKPRNVTWIGKDVGARAWAYMKNGRKNKQIENDEYCIYYNDSNNECDNREVDGEKRIVSPFDKILC